MVKQERLARVQVGRKRRRTRAFKRESEDGWMGG